MNKVALRSILSMVLCAPGILLAQQHLSADMLPCNAADSLVQVRPLYSDSLCSSFVICIPRAVAPHYHRYHTEHVTVLEGTATMQLGDSTFSIAAGQCIVIPKGTPHAVTTTSTTPLRVISVQSPHFDGTDRIFLDP